MITFLDLVRDIPPYVTFTPLQRIIARNLLAYGYCTAHVRRWLLRQA